MKIKSCGNAAQLFIYLFNDRLKFIISNTSSFGKKRTYHDSYDWRITDNPVRFTFMCRGNTPNQVTQATAVAPPHASSNCERHMRLRHLFRSSCVHRLLEVIFFLIKRSLIIYMVKSTTTHTTTTQTTATAADDYTYFYLKSFSSFKKVFTRVEMKN